MSNPPKRGPGRPKGTKNPPGTKNVGRPRKNGEPARPRNIADKGASPAGASRSSSLGVSKQTGATALADPSTSVPAASHSPAPSVPANEHVAVVNDSTTGPSHAKEPRTRLLDAPTLSQLPIAAEGLPACEPSQRRSQDLIDAEQEHTTTSPHQSNLASNVYGSDLNAADVLDDDEALEEEILDEFSHEEDDSAGIDDFSGTGQHVNGGAASPQPPVGTRATLPTWLAGEYQRLRERLTAEMQKSMAGFPKCYQNNSFYDGIDNPYLAAKSTFQLSASLFHQPRFFIWFPHLLVDKIPCPACRDAGRQPAKSSCVYLQKQGFAPVPRRVVGIDRNVYVVGYRYACGHKDCRKTFLSWNPSILNALPPPLRDQFEFRLTHRCGLTSQLVSLLRESFSAGVGPEQFTTMVQAAHYRRYDLLHCQFLEMVLHRSGSGTLSSIWTTTTPFGAFGDRSGYAGFVPSARYFAKLYDLLVEESAPAMRQLIASLPADVIKQDHSFKAIKRLGKVEGVQAFHALFTTVNEYGEIRSMNFTPSKGQNDWGPVLEAMLPSLKSFGHDLPKLVFTDNIRADKDCLLSIFPSLSADVTPVPAVNDLEPLILPSDWSSVLLTSTHQVNFRLNMIMNHHTDASPVVIGLALQWPLDVMKGIAGRVSLIQIAYENIVYLIQTKAFMQDDHLSLPHSLLTFLRSDAYHKVGVNIIANLERLRQDLVPSARSTSFAGQFEIGKMAFDRHAASQANTGLSTLCRHILRHQINRDPTICISPVWASADLPAKFTAHAVLEVYAMWSLYTTLTAVKLPEKVSSSTAAGTPVVMRAPDGRTVARGLIALDRPAKFKGVNVTKSRVIMVVQEVCIPGYLISPTLSSSNAPTSLSAFGKPPFSVLCQASHLETNPVSAIISEELSANFNILEPDPEFRELEASETLRMRSVDHAGFDPLSLDSPPFVLSQEPDFDAFTVTDAEQPISDSAADPATLAMISQMIIDAVQYDTQSQSLVRSRFKGDIWHLFHQFNIPLSHGLRQPFTRALSAALFLTDSYDKRAVEEVLKQKGISYESKLKSHPRWILSRVRRYIPPPEILFSRVAAVMKTYGPLKDAASGEPLFNAKCWDAVRNLLEHIRNGYYSDPPDVPLFYEIGKDRDGLALYRCCRGTNDVEGGVHQNLIRYFESFNVSPCRAINMILVYCVRHNIQVGTLNRTARRYIGHFDIPLKNRVASLRERAAHALHQDTANYGSWVNLEHYERTNEPFGLLPFNDRAREHGSMLPFSSNFVKDHPKTRHQFLSSLQGTRFAVLPIHTHEERALFQSLAHSSPLFSGTRQPDFIALASAFNARANGTNIFYKLPEHIKTHYKSWLDHINEKASVTLSIDLTKRVRDILAMQLGTPPNVPTARPRTLADTVAIPHQAPHSPAVELSSWQLDLQQDPSGPLQPVSLQYRFADQPSGITATPTSSKRPANDTENERNGKKSKRTCTYCYSMECKGRGGQRFCPKKELDDQRNAETQPQHAGESQSNLTAE